MTLDKFLDFYKKYFKNPRFVIIDFDVMILYYLRIDKNVN